MNSRFKRLARGQLSKALARYAAAAASPRPRNGWVAALRQALDMTMQQFAARLGVTTSGALHLEQRERDDTITLGALRRAADALDSDLVYAIVPRHSANAGTNLLDEIIESRARAVAADELRHVAQTMTLEDQTVSDSESQAQLAERAAELAATPRRLWDPDVAPRTKRRASTQRRHSR